MHSVAVEQRIAAVIDQDLQRRLGTQWQRHVLVQCVRYIHPEAIDPAVRPETQRGVEVRVYLRVVPIEVRLLGREKVQVPLAKVPSIGSGSFHHPCPGGSTEV